FCSRNRRGTDPLGWSSVAWKLQDLAGPHRGHGSLDLRLRTRRPSVADRGACRGMCDGGRLPLIKRRLGLRPSDKSLGLDQVPESLLPAVACARYLPLGSFDVAAIVLLFFVGQVLLSRLSFEIGLRDQPY